MLQLHPKLRQGLVPSVDESPEPLHAWVMATLEENAWTEPTGERLISEGFCFVSGNSKMSGVFDCCAVTIKDS